MMPSIGIGSKQPVHQLQLCNKCEQQKPPEGGIFINLKWHCQSCWIKQTTGHYLRQNAKTKTT